MCTDGRCTRFRACHFVEALALDQKIVPPFREVVLRAIGSAQLVVGFCTGRAAWPRRRPSK